MNFPSFKLTLLLLSPLAASAAANSPGDLALTRDYRVADMRGMPSLTSAPGLRFEARHYNDYEATEWQVRLESASNREPPLHENLRSAFFVAQFPSPVGVTLHWSKGSRGDTTDFQPQIEMLKPGNPFTLESYGGRSSDGVMPYFNLASEGGGLIVAVGWSGDWKVSFEALPDGKVKIEAGLKRSRFRLQPGEQVRLPSVVVMPYRGDWLDGQNRFRQLMLHHFTPTNHPPMKLMPVAASAHGMIGFNDTTETNLTALARDIASLNLPLDTFWLDAGWNGGGFPLGQGNPQADAARFPRGLTPLGKVVRETGMRFLVWFEPERAMRGTWLERERPQWLLQPSATPNALHYQERDGFRLLNLGNAQARAWALDTISNQIRESGIAIYRQDFNLHPAFFWQTGEAADEIGLREVRYINGLYDFLDELARRHPSLILDNCASGGRRLDVELMRRCVALWRSDSCWDAKTYPRNVQAMTHGLSLWLPLHGLGAAATDEVVLRSGMGACASFAINFRDSLGVAALRQHLDRYQKVRPLFTKDFYPLTPWSDDPARLLAFQFHDSVSGRGLVQLFRTAKSNGEHFQLLLRGLDAKTRYTFINWDLPANGDSLTGSELMRNGLTVSSASIRDALVLEYSPAQRLAESTTSVYVRDADTWRPPPIRPEGFQFEIQLSSLGTSYEPERVRQSIRGHNLGEYDSAVSKVMAAEWGYSFTHLDGQTDGAGRRIKAGYPTPPVNRAECLKVIEAFLQQQYIADAPHPWASMNGHFPWHHYAAEFGFDQIGSEVGENINNYQWHIALTRGTARQYARPWFMDFSAWHGPSITDYSGGKIWGEHSGPDHGHSMSLVERALFMSYMAGAGQITAEAGGAIAFLTLTNGQGLYRLSPYGEVCKRLREFSLAHPDVGIPLTPFAIVLDLHHGAYPGFGKRRAFWHFDYNAGDHMTWDLINLIWPGGWEVMGKDETGTMVNGPFGDTFDILLQNAPQKVLNSYPCLILSGDIRLSTEEVARYTRYVRQGGTLILNSVYLRDFPNYAKLSEAATRHEVSDGQGRVIFFGPDYQVGQLPAIIHEQLAEHLPVKVSPNVQCLVNVKPGRVLVTLINNAGVTKAPKSKPVVDATKALVATVSWQNHAPLESVWDLKRREKMDLQRGTEATVSLPPGELAIVEFRFK